MVNRCSRSRRHEPSDKNKTKHAIKCHTHGSQTKQHERSTCSRPKNVQHAMCTCSQTLVHFTDIHDCRAATNAQWLNNATSAAYTCSMLAPTHACLRTTSTPTHAAVNPRTRKPNSFSQAASSGEHSFNRLAHTLDATTNFTRWNQTTYELTLVADWPRRT